MTGASSGCSTSSTSSTHECLAIRVARRLEANRRDRCALRSFILREVPGTFVRNMARTSSPSPCRLGSPGSVPRRPTSPPAHRGRNGYVESFNARLRDELLNGEIFYTLKEAQIVIESWRRHYNAFAPMGHSDTARQPRRCSCQPSPLGRLRSPGRLRRPSYPWWSSPPHTNFTLGPPRGADQTSDPDRMSRPAYPRACARLGPSWRSRSRRSAGSGRVACASAACWPMPGTGPPRSGRP